MEHDSLKRRRRTTSAGASGSLFTVGACSMPVPKAGGIDGLFVSRPACPADHSWCLTEPTALHSIGYDVTSLVASGAAGTVVMTSVLVYLDGTVARAELVPRVNRISWAASRLSFLRGDLGVDASMLFGDAYRSSRNLNSWGCESRGNERRI